MFASRTWSNRKISAEAEIHINVPLRGTYRAAGISCETYLIGASRYIVCRKHWHPKLFTLMNKREVANEQRNQNIFNAAHNFHCVCDTYNVRLVYFSSEQRIIHLAILLLDHLPDWYNLIRALIITCCDHICGKSQLQSEGSNISFYIFCDQLRNFYNLRRTFCHHYRRCLNFLSL